MSLVEECSKSGIINLKKKKKACPLSNNLIETSNSSSSLQKKKTLQEGMRAVMLTQKCSFRSGWVGAQSEMCADLYSHPILASFFFSLLALSKHAQQKYWLIPEFAFEALFYCSCWVLWLNNRIEHTSTHTHTHTPSQTQHQWDSNQLPHTCPQDLLAATEWGDLLSFICYCFD